LKTRASWVERATTIRTGVLLLAFISRCTAWGGTQDEVAGPRLVHMLEALAGEEPRVPGDDINGAFGIAMMVHGGEHSGL
jgi:hypothetical protein